MIKINKSSFKTYKFGDIALNISERAEPKVTKLDIYVGLEHLDSDCIHIKRKGHPSDVKGTKLRVYPGDIIFGKRRAYQRKAAIVDFDGICSAHAMVVRAKSKVILPKLLPFFIHSDAFMHRAVDVSEGSLSPTIKWKILADQVFKIPSLDDQERIANLLWSIDTAEGKYGEFAKNYTVWVESYSDDILHISLSSQSRLGIKNDNGWQLKSVKEIAPLQRGFDLPNSQLKEGKWPVAYSNGIGNFHSEYKVKGPGVFTGRSGTIGNVFYVEENYWPHNTALWVTDFKGNHPKYIYYLYRKLEFNNKQAGTGVPTLNRNLIHEIKAMVPSYGVQLEIADKLDVYYARLQQINAVVMKINDIKKTLINQIFG